MSKQVLHNMTILLDEADQGQIETLAQRISGLLLHVNFTGNLYLVTRDFPLQIPHIERIQKEVGAFLRERLFVRLYMHLVHPVAEASLEAIKQGYQRLKGMTHEFDEEGYRHQELPRLMLLPILVPGPQSGLDGVRDLLDILKGLFMMPSLYLGEATAFFSKDESVLSRTEKVYNGIGDAEDMAQVLTSLREFSVFEESCDHMTLGRPFVSAPCSTGIIIGVKEGVLYPCMDALRSKEGLSGAWDGGSAQDAMARCEAHVRESRDCAACRERTSKALVDLPLPEETRHEMGALFYHLGAHRQEEENHVLAIQDYKQSLKLSPPAESGAIYFRLGLSFTKTWNFDDAVDALQKAESTYREHDYFHFHVGVCHFERGDYRSALEAFSRAAALKPRQEDQVRILIYMGTCHNYLGEYDEARLVLEKAKKMAPDMKEVFNALGFSYFQLKDFDKAIENLQRAVEIDPNSAIDFASLGANYREKGDIPKAIAMFERALAIDPTMAAAQENLERLKDTP